MKGLFINTCLSQVEVALIKDSEVFASESWTQSRSESSLLQPSIIKLLDEAGWKLEDIEEVFLVTGPGSFTAIRVGVIVAKAIAVKLGIGIHTITTFDYLNNCVEGDFLLNAGGNSVYRFGKDIEMKIVDLSEIADFEAYSLLLSDKQKNRYGLDNFELKRIGDYWRLVMDKFDKISAKDVEKVEPNYVKEPNIT